MYVTLLRDNVPDKIREEGKYCPCTTVQSDEVFIDLLRAKLVELTDIFNKYGTLEAIAEIQLVVDTFIEFKPELYEQIKADQLATYGTYSKRIMFVDANTSEKTENAGDTTEIKESIEETGSAAAVEKITDLNESK